MRATLFTPLSQVETLLKVNSREGNKGDSWELGVCLAATKQSTLLSTAQPNTTVQRKKNVLNSMKHV